jgi:HSP20 family protein
MKKNESLTKLEDKNQPAPVFVEAEKLFEKLAAITRETAARAHNFFLERGSQLGTHLEDWLRAEAETLRAAPVKITDTDKTVIVLVAVPGFKPEEIEVSIKDDILLVSGETRTENEKEEQNTFYSEWRSDRFMRKLTLPTEVETDNAEAKLKDGILTLTLKKKAAVEATKVAVKTA